MSVIKRAAYNPDDREVVVQFGVGGIYVYHKVSRKTWRNYRKAKSKGRFLNRQIKNKHEFSLISK